MASRRIRIKGIANIPQRKKNQENNVSNVDTENSDCIFPDLKEEKPSVDLLDQPEVNLNTNSCESVERLLSTTENNLDSAIDAKLSDSLKDLKAEVTEDLNTSKDDFNIKSEIPFTEISADAIKKHATQVSQRPETKNQIFVTNVPRRKFLKPGININAVKKRQVNKDVTETIPTTESITISEYDMKQETSNKRIEKENNLRPNEKVVVISEIRIPKYENKSLSVACDLTKIISRDSNNGGSNQGSVYSEVTLNETHLGVSEGPVLNSSVVTFSPYIKKVVPEIHNVSDSEYPPPPPSPSKINRSRIKAIPRLSQRKASCSASESEDETRKYGRIRNNSVCSVVSTSCLEPPTPTSETVTSKDVTPNLPKKLNRTEQSRKLAEARREFHKRFGTNNPDKQRLKMIDLIFYNPTSNPMSKKSSKPPSENEILKTEKAKEEIVDDPFKEHVVEEKENDADNGMPVPQIKIGPSGEIILDEQSLNVENVEVARQKEQLQNSQLVNGDFDTGYGIYKRARRALAWTQKETIRFYKALNLIGTDFTVMTQLFPKRTRRELKIKFKKEERINKQLIDKAIMQPCNYNFADLKREIDIEEEEEVALQKLKEEEMEKNKQLQLDKVFKRKNRKEKDAVANANISKDTTNDPVKDESGLPPKKRLKSIHKSIKPRKTKTKTLTIKSVLDDDSDADISDMETQSESEEEETIPFLKPTRSGRMPKSTVRFTTIVDQTPTQYFYDPRKTAETSAKSIPDSTKTFTTQGKLPQKLNNSAIRNRRSSSLSSLESNSDKLVPGSVVIIMEEDPNGKSEYRVFMVTPEKKMEPLDLNSEIVAKLVAEGQNEQDNQEFILPDLPPVPEKNVTIPACDDKHVKIKPQDLNSEIVAKLVIEGQNEQHNQEFILPYVPPVPEKNVTIPACDDKHVKIKPQDLNSEIVAKLVIEGQNEQHNQEFILPYVPPVPEKNDTIPACDDKHVKIKPHDFNSEIEAKLITDRQHEEDHPAFIVPDIPTVPDKSVAIPDENHDSKSKDENQEILLINYPDPDISTNIPK